MPTFFRQAVVLFVAFRLADLVNLVASLYLVPRFVAPNDLGAVLPVSTLATSISIPAFAVAMVFLREGAVLAHAGRWGEWKSLVRGVFLATTVVLALGAVLAATVLPRYLRAVGVGSPEIGVLALAGAILGCVAPVYSDALNALQRFRALGVVEVVSSLSRLIVLAIFLPFRALTGFFLGGIAQPLARILSSVLLLRRELARPARPFWTIPVARRLGLLTAGVTLYLLTPLLASLAEQSILRISLGPDDSAAYYLLTRLSGLLDYLTLPLLFVLFPRVARSGNDPSGNGPSDARRLIHNCQAVTVLAALLMTLLAVLWGQTPESWGQTPLSMLPNGEKFASYAKFLPFLIFISALNACQIFATNAAVSAGNLRFLFWHTPLNLAYLVLLTVAPGIVSDLPALLVLMTAVAALRFVFGQTIKPIKSTC